MPGAILWKEEISVKESRYRRAFMHILCHMKKGMDVLYG